MAELRRVRPVLSATFLAAWLAVAASATAQAPNAAAVQKPVDPKEAAAAAVEAAEAEQASPVVAYPAEKVAEEADRTMRRLDRLKPSQEARDVLATIQEEYDNAHDTIETRIRHGEKALDDDVAFAAMKDAQSQLAGLFDPIRQREERLDRLSGEAGESVLEIEALGTNWLATRDFARSQGAADAVMRRIQVTREAIDERLKQVKAHRDAILALRDTLLDARSRAEVAHQALDEVITSRTQQLLSADEVAVWRGAFWTTLRSEWNEQGLKPIRQSFATARTYLGTHRKELVLQLAIFLALAAVLLRGRSLAREAVAQGHVTQASPVFERPWSASLLVAFALHPFLYKFQPLLFTELMAILGVIPGIRVVRAFSSGPVHTALLPLGAIFLFDRLRHILAPLHMTWRLLHLLELALAIGLVVWFVRATTPQRLAEQCITDGTTARLGLAARVGLAALVLGWLAEMGGWSGISGIAASGVLTATWAAVFFYAGARVLRDLLVYLLQSRAAAESRVLEAHGSEIRDRIGRAIDFLAVVAWAAVVLNSIGLAQPLLAVGNRVLDAGIEVGALSLNLGHVLTFGVTLWISFLAARFVAFVLEGELLPRLELARGVPYALTSLARYTILFVGFLFALAAGGFDVDRIAFLAGGLGVGIGFGLQNVVNNFVSGLILLFERPVQVGDSVTLPAQNLMGRIRVIGIRASVVRTWDGAEVIVPNGDLVSGVVTNWTLSDRQRRLDIPVEVARGTEPRRVVDLLVGVAAANENILADPAPVCFFLGFGESSLRFELRMWVRDFDVGLSTRSNVAIAVAEALRAEGLEVPIPRVAVQMNERPDPR